MPSLRLYASAAGPLAVAALALAGCGGTGSDADTIYVPAKTRECLQQADLKLAPVTPGTDFVASTALNGAVGVRLALNEVTISFGRNEAEAGRIARAYRRFGRESIPIDQVLELQRNVVLLWSGQPNPRDADVVHNCLR